MSERLVDPRALQAQSRRLLRRQQASPGGPWLHAEVARRMAERLQVIRLQPQQIVEWWGALGASAAVLDAAYPDALRTVVEPDAAWAAETGLRRRRPWWSVARWRAASQTVVDQQQPLTPQGCQLVWANMVLHAEIDPPQLLARWHAALQADGFVMFSSLGPDTLKQLRSLYATLGWGPIGVDFVDMHDLGDMLVHAGFADPVMDQETLTLTWATAADLLAELRGLGGNVSPERASGMRTPRWKAALERALEQLRGPDGRLQLAFEVSYGHAFKAAPRLPAADSTSVSLDEMRKLVREPRKSGLSIGLG